MDSDEITAAEIRADAGMVDQEGAFAKQERVSVGVVVERRKIDNPWQDYAWRAVAVIPGAPAQAPEDDWPVLEAGEERQLFHAGTLPLELFRKETEGYKVNLSQTPPRLFVVLRQNEDPDVPHDFLPFLVTACPYEAQDYLDSGEEIVDAVALPAELVGFIEAFCHQHHVDVPFKKRKRKPHDPRKEGFDGPPPGAGRPPRGQGSG